jgi:hypothetical protein
VLRGTSPADAAARTLRAYAAREFSTAPGAMAYMLSPQQWLIEADPHWRPHLMFYFDRSAPAPAWGAGGSIRVRFSVDAKSTTSLQMEAA